MGVLNTIGTNTPATSAQINSIINELNSRYGSVQWSQAGSQNITAASDYEILTGWSVEITNTLGGGSLSGGQFTMPSAMTCAISAACSVLHGATEYRLAVFVNGTNIRQTRDMIGSAAASSANGLSIPVFDWVFAAGDVVDMRVWANATGLSTTAAASETWWRMKRTA